MRTAALLAAIGVVALAGSAAAAEAGRVPLTRVARGELGGWIELPVRIEGRAGRWLLDTGASRNLVSPAFVRRLGLTRKGNARADTPLGQLQGREVELPALRIGDVERRGQSALEVELSVLFGDAADGIEGVVGVPLLEGMHVDLDLRAWSAAFGDGAASDCPQGLAAVAVERFRSLPVITLAMRAARERYVLDTGNPGGLIRIEAKAPTAATPGLVLPGDMRLTVLAEAALGPQLRGDVPIVRLTSPPLGDGARWRLDLGRERLCVEPGRFRLPGGFGLDLERRGGDLVIKLVLPGSPAERAGLQAGTKVTRWAGLDASRPLAELWQAVQGRDEVTVGVEGPAREVTLGRAIFAPAER